MARCGTVLRLVVLFAAALGMCTSAPAQSIWYVDDDAPGDPGPGDSGVSNPLENGGALCPFDAIQEALDAAGSGDLILIADGIYSGQGNYNLDPGTLTVTVRSQSGNAEACLIDGQGSYYHGGFVSRSGAMLTIADLTIRRCQGAVYVLHGSATITGCRLLDNTLGSHDHGAAVASSSSTIELRDCLIRGNEAGDAGGLFLVSGSALIEDCDIIENRATFGAGAMYVECDAVVTNCRIEDNTAISCAGICATPGLTAQNCLIRGNRAYDWNGAIDGGKYINCLITENTAKNRTVGYASRLVNCTVFNNTPGNGAALSAGQIVNSIVWNNGPEPLTATTAATYSCIQGGWPGTGNIDGDPFAFDNDPHLAPDSPCIDAGTDSSPEALPAVDFDGNPRVLPDGGIVDMGVYEFNPDRPTLAVSFRDELHACPLGGADPEPLTLGIRNAGGGMLSWVLSEDCPWLTCTPMSGASSGEINAVMLTVDTASLPHGDHVATLTITAPGALEETTTLTFTLRRCGTLHVPHDYAGVGAAVEAAVDGDLVLIADGTYSGAHNRQIDLAGKSITIASASGDPNLCVLSCDGGNYGLRFTPEHGPAATVSGITVSHVGGPGLLLESHATAVITNCQIRDCGRGLLLNHETKAILSNCVIANNGGGFDVQNSGSIDCSNCVISGNGGAVYHTEECFCFAGSNAFRFDNCLFSDNHECRGGAILVEQVTSVTIELRNCILTGNTASEVGGALYIEGGFLYAYNTIFWGNEAPVGPQISLPHGRLVLNRCDLAGGVAAIDADSDDITWSNLIDVNPLFTNPAAGDYRLLPGSPCIDAGDNTLVSADWADIDGDGDTTERIPLDLAGQPRFADDPATADTGVAAPPLYMAIVDLGAYELPGPALGDLDGDGDADFADALVWAGCFAGPAVDLAPGCSLADLSGDADADLDDFSLLQQLVRGD